jgi:hypothetical protein
MWWHCGVLVDKKMELGDRALGLLLLLFSSTLFAYYTFWVIITVSVDSTSLSHSALLCLSVAAPLSFSVSLYLSVFLFLRAQ